MKDNRGLKFQSYKITDKEQVTDDTVIYKIAGNLNFSPGQFVQVKLDHFGEATFAPCSDPNQKNFFNLCIRDQGSTSAALTKLQVGEKISIRGPYGNGWPIDKLIGKNILLLVGGMGIVPIRPLIFELLKYKKEFKKISLLAGFKTPDHVLFNDDFLDWKKKFHYLQVAVEKGDKNWWGESCMITELIKNHKLDPKNTVVLMCGPEIMFPFCNEVLCGPKKIEKKNIYVSMERRMECGVGLCQHCNIGKYYVCKDGPIFRWDKIEPEISK